MGGWSDDEADQVLTGSAGAGGTDGVRASRRARLGVGGDEPAQGITPPLAQQSRPPETEAVQQTPNAVVDPASAGPKCRAH